MPEVLMRKGSHHTSESLKKMSASQTGKKLSDETKRKISESSTGRLHTEESKRKIGESKRGEKNYNWAGDRPCYFTVHSWIRAIIDKPDVCPNCGKPSKLLELHNISGDYSRDPSDWVYLCRKCHFRLDGRISNITKEGREISLIQCDVCGGRFNSNATTYAKCPYCDHKVRVREEVIVTDPTAHAGYFKTDPYVDRLIKQGIVKELK
jgi:DNA-directed RNA polymerase subunit RPC12/RpoP